ncbi:MAG: sterol desaturase family protein, partial [Pseudomonadota bacterium]
MSAVARVLARYGFVPIMLFGFNAAAIAIVMSGQSYLWLGLVLLGAIAFSHAAERIAPAFAEWNDDHEDTGTNIVHAAVYEMSSINGVLLIPLLVWLL